MPHPRSERNYRLLSLLLYCSPAASSTHSPPYPVPCPTLNPPYSTPGNKNPLTRPHNAPPRPSNRPPVPWKVYSTTPSNNFQWDPEMKCLTESGTVEVFANKFRFSEILACSRVFLGYFGLPSSPFCLTLDPSLPSLLPSASVLLSLRSPPLPSPPPSR